MKKGPFVSEDLILRRELILIGHSLGLMGKSQLFSVTGLRVFDRGIFAVCLSVIVFVT